MHERNGLWDAISRPEALPLLDVEAEAISVLQSLANKHDFVLCGSGVSHFDRRFLKSDMPRFERWFRYYSIEVCSGVRLS
jgi:oligoribonuclease (3'-5' exoribonuclease)